MTLLSAPSEAYFYYDSFYLEELAERNKRNLNDLLMYTGKPGRGKSMAGLKTCQILDPNFNADNIVFNGRQFREAVEASKPDAWILWDEPNKGLSHRDWYQEINKAVTVYLQTGRFRKKNVVFALPKASLLDKAARAVMTAECIFYNRGICSVYMLEPNHFGSTPENFKYNRGEAQFTLPTRELIDQYEAKRDVWHTKEFPVELFAPEESSPFIEPKKRKHKEFPEIWSMLEKGPLEQYQKNGKLSPLLVSSLTGCGDQLARKVIVKWENDHAKQW